MQYSDISNSIREMTADIASQTEHLIQTHQVSNGAETTEHKGKTINLLH